MRAFVLAFTSAILIEILLFYSLGIWLCSPQKSYQPIVKLKLSSIYTPPPKRIIKSVNKIPKPKLKPIVPEIIKVPQKPQIKNKPVKPKVILKNIVKPIKKLPKKLKPKKTVLVKKKIIKKIEKKKEFNPYKSIAVKKPVLINIKKIKPTANTTTQIIKVANDKIYLPAPTISKNTTENKLYLSKVLRILSRRKKYPRLAKKRGIEGEILISFKIGNSGKTYSVNILKGNNRILIKAAKKLIKKSKLPTPPKSWKAHTIVKIPINYKLRD